MTRTVCVGTPKPGVQQMYDVVLEAQETALKMVRPGVTGKQIHNAVCDVFKKHGYASDSPGYEHLKVTTKARFSHSTGHGVGLDIHEQPGIGAYSDTPLQEGMVITIEPGLYEKGFGGIRIEDTVAVTATGYRQLTPYPKTLQIV
jgi:Xaa-Pro aminopeptidase